MPAIRSSLTNSASAVMGSSFNRSSRLHRCGPGFILYPQEEDMFHCSNTANCDDESWHELGLSDFVFTNVQITHRWFNRYSQGMVEYQCGLLNSGLEPWDVEETYDPILEASLGYSASMGMMLFEQNK